MAGASDRLKLPTQQCAERSADRNHGGMPNCVVHPSITLTRTGTDSQNWGSIGPQALRL